MRLLFTIILYLVCATVNAANYYIHSGGSDSNVGTSHAQAWRTLDKVESYMSSPGFSAGDRIYLHESQTWVLSNNFVFTQSGSSATDCIADDSSCYVFDAYHMVGTTHTAGLSSTGTRPQIVGTYGINGNFVSGKNANAGPVVDDPDNTLPAVPNNHFAGLFQINGDYVVVKNLHIRNSAGRCLVFNDGADYNYAYNNRLEFCSAAWFRTKTGTNNTFRSNTAYGGNMFMGVNGSGTAAGPCVEILYQKNTIVEDNYLEGCYRETIGLYWVNATYGFYNIVRGNTIVRSCNIGIYFSQQTNSVAERNILVGYPDADKLCGIEPYLRNWPQGSGIRGITESNYKHPWGHTEDNIVRNNYILNQACIGDSIQYGALYQDPPTNTVPWATPGRVGNEYYNNLCIDPDARSRGLDAGGLNSTVTMTAKNNIIWGMADTCRASADEDFDYNYLSTVPTDTDCVGANDVNAGISLKRSDWTTIIGTTLPSSTDGTAVAGSTTLNAGVALTSVKWTTAEFPTVMTNRLIDQTFDLTLNSTDFDGDTRANPPDIGPHEDTVAAPSTYSAPKCFEFGNGSDVTGMTEDPCSGTYISESNVTLTDTLTSTFTQSIANTVDDTIYQKARYCSGNCSVSIPFANGTYDITLLTGEFYFGAAGPGTCTGVEPVRCFDVDIEGALVQDEFCPCKEAGGVSTALRKKYNGIVISDSTLDIAFQQGSTGTQSNNPVFMGLEVVTASGTTNLTIGNAAPTVSIINPHPDGACIDVVSACQASTNATDGSGVLVSAKDDTNLTNGSTDIDTIPGCVNYTPSAANITGDVGSFEVSLQDTDNLSTCDVSLTLLPQPSNSVEFRAVGMTSISNIDWWLFDANDSANPSYNLIAKGTGASTDSTRKITITDAKIVAGNRYMVLLWPKADKLSFIRYVTGF